MGEQIFSSLFSPVVQTNLLWSQELLKLKISFTSWLSLWDVTTRTAMRIQCICVGAFADKHIASESRPQHIHHSQSFPFIITFSFVFLSGKSTYHNRCPLSRFSVCSTVLLITIVILTASRKPILPGGNYSL